MIDVHISVPNLESLKVEVEQLDLVEPLLVPWMVDTLRGKGYIVELPHEKERPSDFQKRLGISNRRFHQALSSHVRPPVKIQRGPRRIHYIISNPVFDDFCRDGLTESI